MLWRSSRLVSPSCARRQRALACVRELDAPEPEVVQVMVGVASGEVSELKLAAWLRRHLRGVGLAAS